MTMPGKSPRAAAVVQLARAMCRPRGTWEEDLPLEAFTSAGNVLTFGVVPARVDLINSIDGVIYDEARPNAVRGRYGTVEVTFIGLADLVRNKQATPRAKDKGDVEELTQG
jgi:hypothetical protein